VGVSGSPIRNRDYMQEVAIELKSKSLKYQSRILQMYINLEMEE
jgi:hypothetical protein